MLMFYPLNKSNSIRATYKRGSTRKNLTINCPRLEEPTAISRSRWMGKRLCQFRGPLRGRILIRELFKETWILSFKTSNPSKWRTKGNKISSPKTLDLLAAFPTQPSEAGSWVGSEWCPRAWCSLKRETALWEAWQLTEEMTYLALLALIKLTVTCEIVR